MGILEVAIIALRCLRGPWVAGGDWNISPELLRSSRWLEIVDGVLFSPGLATCGNNIYDYFVVHRSLMHAVVGVQRVEDGGMLPASLLLMQD